MGLKQKLKSIGAKFKRQESQTHQELLIDVIHDLEDVTSTISDLSSEMHTEFQKQIVDQQTVLRGMVLQLFDVFLLGLKVSKSTVK